MQQDQFIYRYIVGENIENRFAMGTNNAREKVVELIKTKLTVKRDVFVKTKEVFQQLKEVLKEIEQDLIKQTLSDEPILIEVADIGEYEVRIRVGGDTIVFLMHSNVFDFDSKHRIFQHSYVKNERYNSLCGQIFIYNFLSDSFKYNRPTDLGYLTGRLFVNKDLHFFVDGPGQMGFLFNDFQNAVLDKSALGQIVDQSIKQCLEFDMYTSPYRQVQLITVAEINQTSSEMRMQTGKRLGFKFKSDQNISL